MLLKDRTLAETIAATIVPIRFPFRDEEERTFEGGQYYGEDKVATHLTQLLPFINQVRRVQFLEKNTSYYSLF